MCKLTKLQKPWIRDVFYNTSLQYKQHQTEASHLLNSPLNRSWGLFCDQRVSTRRLGIIFQPDTKRLERQKQVMNTRIVN